MVPAAQPQTPAVQGCPVGHTLPHAPQLVALVLVFTHAAPQRVVPPGHAHTPPTHDCAAGQTVPQAPQLLRSVLALTHAVPQ